MDELLQAQQLMAVLVVHEHKLQLAALDDETLKSAKMMLEAGMNCVDVQFELHHLKFFQSVEWAKVHSNLEANDMLLITIEYDKKHITVEGIKTEVDRAVVVIKQEFEERAKFSKCLELTRGLVRLAEFHKDNIKSQLSAKAG